MQLNCEIQRILNETTWKSIDCQVYSSFTITSIQLLAPYDGCLILLNSKGAPLLTIV